MFDQKLVYSKNQNVNDNLMEWVTCENKHLEGLCGV